jgi:hypothetical protein
MSWTKCVNHGSQGQVSHEEMKKEKEKDKEVRIYVYFHPNFLKILKLVNYKK